jgi:Tfp pilus assembly protein PilN
MAILKTTEKKGLNLSRGAKPTVIIPFTPTMPDVNLLPPRVFDAVHAKAAQRKIMVAGGVLVLLVAGTFIGQTAQIMIANKALEQEAAKTADLEKKVKELNPVKVFYDGVAAQKVTVKKTMARELYFSNVASELVNTSPKGSVHIETMTVAADGGGTATAGATCPSANPFKVVPIVTCLQFTGTASGREAVSALLVNLNNNNKFVNVYVPVTDSGDGKQVTFNGSVGITEKFFSNRYANDEYLIKGLGAQR